MSNDNKLYEYLNKEKDRVTSRELEERVTERELKERDFHK